jgi:hypothetical protein
LLASLDTVTITFPVVAPLGTAAAMLVSPQLDGCARVPLNVTVLDPCDEPKFDPLMVTEVPTGPEVVDRLLIAGRTTVKLTPLLESPHAVTTTFPVVAPLGTGTAMLVALQLVGAATMPLNVTTRESCDEPKFVPVTVTEVPTGPEVVERLVIAGASTVKLAPLLRSPDTVTITFPVVAQPGTVAVMLVALQLVTSATTPLNVTTLVPCVAPKLVPVMVTEVARKTTTVCPTAIAAFH